MNIRTLFASLMIFATLTSYGQINQWLIAFRSNQGNDKIPYVDFTSGNPVFITKSIADVYSDQAVALGRYCTSCSDTVLENEFYITGNKSQPYTNGDGQIFNNGYMNRMMTNYYSTTSCTNKTEYLDYNNSNGVPITLHNSVSEIASAEGIKEGTFWLISQGDVYGSNTQGKEFVVYLVDLNTNSPFNNVSINITPSFLDAPINTIFNEGVGFGPMFVYNGNLPYAINSLDGRLCRSIYIASFEDTMYHVILDVVSKQIFKADKAFMPSYSYDLFYSEIELSFPRNNTIYNNHPEWVSYMGERGAGITNLDENGNFINASCTLLSTTSTCAYGGDFDKENKYFYYAERNGPHASNNEMYIKQFDLSSFNGNLISPTIHTFSFPFYDHHNMVAENAGNGKLYMIVANYGSGNPQSASFYEIANASSSNASVKLVSNLINNNGVYDNLSGSMGLGFPDWVNGESPLQTKGFRIDICLGESNLPTNSPQEVDAYYGDRFIKKLYIFPGDCDKIFVCKNDSLPNTTNDTLKYSFILNNDLKSEEIVTYGNSKTIVFENYEALNFIKNYNSFSFTVYPNPSETNFNLEFNDYFKDFSVEISDIAGRVVYDKLFNSGSKSINIDLLRQNKGIYFIKVIDSNTKQKFVKKIILQ